MGNAQSLTRTSGALDLFVAELGGDIVYEGRYAHALSGMLEDIHMHMQSRLRAVSEDGQVSTQEWVPRGEGLHQAGPGDESAQVP